MYDPEMRKDCPMRGNLGNCSPVGGFCMDAVSDEICEVAHNAYDLGFVNAVRMLKEQEAVEPRLDIDALVCGNCGHGLVHQERLGDTVLFEERHNYCPHCGRMVRWE